MVLTTQLALLPHCAPTLRMIAAECSCRLFAININDAFGLSYSTAENQSIGVVVVASSKGDHQYFPNQRPAAIVPLASIWKLEQRADIAQHLLGRSKAVLPVAGGHQKLHLCNSGFASVQSANKESTFPQSRGVSA